MQGSTDLTSTKPNHNSNEFEPICKMVNFFSFCRINEIIIVIKNSNAQINTY